MIVDSAAQTVTVLVLAQDNEQEAGYYRGEERIISPNFAALTLTVNQSDRYSLRFS